MIHAHEKFLATINDAIIPLENNVKTILNNIADARFVLIGEATHGTREFYETRAEITKQLILHKGFNVIAVEGDWPSIYPLHRYVNGTAKTDDLASAFHGLTRFPRWMWCNETIPPFIKWLRKYNEREAIKKIGFYGLDLYSLYTSINAVISYLTKIDPEAAGRAIKRYSCFDQVNNDPQEYGLLVAEEIEAACIDEVTEELKDLEQHSTHYLQNQNVNAKEEYFYALQNSRLIKNAEKYYRHLFNGHHSTWNIRDTHMAETVGEIEKHISEKYRIPAKIIIWAHNSHLGDARATEANVEGEINLGQLLREKYKNEVYNIGFSTYTGTVTAATNWGEEPQIKEVVPGFTESYEELFHEVKVKNFILFLRNINSSLKHYLSVPRLQRAIGVIYRPETERYSHYFFYTFGSTI